MRWWLSVLRGGRVARRGGPATLRKPEPGGLANQLFTVARGLPRQFCSPVRVGVCGNPGRERSSSVDDAPSPEADVLRTTALLAQARQHAPADPVLRGCRLLAD